MPPRGAVCARKNAVEAGIAARFRGLVVSPGPFVVSETSGVVSAPRSGSIRFHFFASTGSISILVDRILPEGLS